MLTVKFGEKELNIKFGYEATVKTTLSRNWQTLKNRKTALNP